MGSNPTPQGNDQEYQTHGDGLKVMINDIVLNIRSKKKVPIKVQKPPESSNGQGQQPEQGAGLTMKIDKDTELNINSYKRVEMIVQKPEGEKQEEKKPEAKGDEEDGKQGGSGQREQGTETMLQNAITKLKNYKGIVITALIAVSLGFFLRRKFKGSVPH